MKAWFHKCRRGFTLVELLVVVMVIGILASLAIARYANFRDKSHVAAATYDLDLVRKLLAYYEVDWNSYPPAAASYQDLQDQLVDSDGNTYGKLPLSNTFEFVSYGLDVDGKFIVRVRAADNGGSIIRATPETITRE